MTTPVRYEQLDADRIVETIRELSGRIHQRFPDSGLYGVSRQLHKIGTQARQRAARIARPLRWMQVLAGALTALVVATLVWAVVSIEPAMPGERISIWDAIQAFEAALNEVVLQEQPRKPDQEELSRRFHIAGLTVKPAPPSPPHTPAQSRPGVVRGSPGPP